MAKKPIIAFLLDYVPLLISHPTTAILFLYLYELKDDNNLVNVTYEELEEHLGVSNPTISSALQMLQKLNLLQKMEFNQFEGSRYKIKDLQSLTDLERKALFAAHHKRIDTNIRRRMLDTEKWPDKYRYLVDTDHLKDALQKIGIEHFNIAELTKHFKLDRDQVRLLMSNSLFREQFKIAKKMVLSGKEAVEQRELVVFKEDKELSEDEIYDMLMSSNIGKDGTEKPIESWRSLQFIRYFCLLHERTLGRRFIIGIKMSNNRISCRDLDTFKIVYDNLSKSAQKVVDYIDWIFKEGHKTLPDGVTSTAVLKFPTLLNRFLAKYETQSTKESDKINADFKKWVETNVPDVLKMVPLERNRDLVWLKEYYDKYKSESAKMALDEAKRRKIMSDNDNFVFD